MRYKTPRCICLAVSIGFSAQPGDENWSWRFFPKGPTEEVKSIQVVGQDVYVGGSFTGIGPHTYPGIAKWNGGGWSTLGGGLHGSVAGIAVDSRGFVFVAGSLRSGKQGDGTYALAQWDGQAWLFPPQAKDRISYGPIAVVGTEAFLTFSDQKEIFRWTGTELVSLKSAPNGARADGPP